MLTEAVDFGKAAKLCAAVENAEHALERARIAANEANYNLAAFNRSPAMIWTATKTPIAEAATAPPGG